MKAESDNFQLIEKLFFRLLPIQIFLAAVSAVNGIVSGFLPVTLSVQKRL